MGNGRQKTSNDLTDAEVDAIIPDADDLETGRLLGFIKDLIREVRSNRSRLNRGVAFGGP